MIKQIAQLDSKNIVKLEISIDDNSRNGYNNFNVSMSYYSRDKRPYEEKIVFNNKLYWNDSCGFDTKIMIKYFPEFIPICNLRGCDTFGFNSYLFGNIYYNLHNGNIDSACNDLRISKAEGLLLLQLDKLEFTIVVRNMMPRLKTEADIAIALYNKHSDIKYNRTEKISYKLYNDLHFEFVTQKDGWNVCNKMLEADKPNSYDIKFGGLNK
jgi:hypothetical protein